MVDCRGTSVLKYVCVLLSAAALHSSGPADLQAQSFQDLVKSVYAAPDLARQELADRFLAGVTAFPIIENDSVCIFVWRGDASRVAVAGDQNGWKPARSSMTRLSTTNVWFRSEVFPSDTRLDYKFVIDSTRWLPDERNPSTMQSGFGSNSELRMPAWIAPQEIRYDSTIEHGAMVDTSIQSAVFGSKRKVSLYIPPGDVHRDGAPGIIVVHDGYGYIDIARMQNILDNLIAARQIRPVFAVFVPPVQRGAEYTGGDMGKHTSFIVSELLPIVAQKYGLTVDSGTCAVMGASNGGNISLWLAVSHPEVFGRVAAQSTNVTESVAQAFLHGPKRDFRIYLDFGTYDIPELLPRVKNLREILDSRGYTYVFREVHDGHSWGNWRARVGDILRLFFSGPPSGQR
jgi:enterochelin esterase-like enzyme